VTTSCKIIKGSVGVPGQGRKKSLGIPGHREVIRRKKEKRSADRSAGGETEGFCPRGRSEGKRERAATSPSARSQEGGKGKRQRSATWFTPVGGAEGEKKKGKKEEEKICSH